MITDDDLRKAWDRIGRTADGQLAYLYLQKVMFGVLESNDAGALQRHDGRRSLARDLMAMMAEGIEARAGTSPDDKPITFERQQRASARPEARGARRRVTLDTPVEGWDRSDSTAKN